MHTTRSNQDKTRICDSENAAVNFDKMQDGDFPWLDFQTGALSLQCTRQQGDWEFMHCQKDWFALGFQTTQTTHCDVHEPTPTIFVTRSGDYSPFALAHDWVNLVTLAAAAEVQWKDVQLVMMDRMTVGFYSPVWQAAFSPRRPVLWFPDLRLKMTGKVVCYNHAWFNIPARLSPLYNEDDCRGSSLLRLTADLVAASVGGLRTISVPNLLCVTIIIRRNYRTGHPIGRRFSNPEVYAKEIASAFPTAHVAAIDYADFDFDQQINVSRSTDLLIGMHGAGLIQMMFLPAHAAVFEFFCPDRPSSNTRYQNLANRLDLDYASMSLDSDDGIIPIPSAVDALRGLVLRVEARKKSLP